MNNKRYLSFFLLIFSASFLSAQVLIPDPIFEQALIDLGYDTDGVINGQISNADALNVMILDVNSKNISDLTGIEGFPNLTFLYCYSNQLTTIDVSNNTALVQLLCDNNQLTTLDVSNNPLLSSLWCSGNQLTTLDVSNNQALLFLICGGNQFTTLDLSNNPALLSLSCGDNQLTSLDLSSNPLLTQIFCSGNQLTSLDVSNLPLLEQLYCFSNQLTSLDVSNNAALLQLSCGDNQLTSLDLTNNPALTTLWCQDNDLNFLDVRNGNNSLFTEPFPGLDPFNALDNPDLLCILVDDVSYSSNNWPQKDPQTSFTTDPNDPACFPPVPTLSQWAVMILGLIFMIVGVLAIREKRVVVTKL